MIKYLFFSCIICCTFFLIADDDKSILPEDYYKLEPQEPVFYGIALEKEKNIRDAMFENFFINNFNESEHTVKVNGMKKLIAVLEKTKELLKAVYTENPVYLESDEDKKKSKNKENLNQVYAALRFVDFINNKEER